MSRKMLCNNNRVVVASSIASMLFLSACADVTVTPLTPDRGRADGPSGAQYYLPKPYLLVALMPPSSGTSNSDAHGESHDPPLPIPSTHEPGSGGSGHPAPGAAPATTNGGGTPKDSGTPKDGGTPKDSTSQVASDLSFGKESDRYIVKLIYLPDLEHPMAINVQSGLFGTASMAPTLQDGWMLTSFTASSENKISDLITAVAPLITPLLGGAPAAKGGLPKPAGFNGSSGADPILAPGLYAFDYNKDGALTRLCSVTLFTPKGTVRGDCNRN